MPANTVVCVARISRSAKKISAKASLVPKANCAKTASAAWISLVLMTAIVAERRFVSGSFANPLAATKQAVSKESAAKKGRVCPILAQGSCVQTTARSAGPPMVCVFAYAGWFVLLGKSVWKDYVRSILVVASRALRVRVVF